MSSTLPLPLRVTLVKRDAGRVWECRLVLSKVDGIASRFLLTIHSGAVEQGLTRSTQSGTWDAMDLAARNLVVKKRKAGFLVFMVSKGWDVYDEQAFRRQKLLVEHFREVVGERVKRAELEPLVADREWTMQVCPRGRRCVLVRMKNRVTQVLDDAGRPLPVDPELTDEAATVLPEGVYDAALEEGTLQILDAHWNATGTTADEPSLWARVTRLAPLLRDCKKIDSAFVYSLPDGKRAALHALAAQGRARVAFHRSTDGGATRFVQLN